MFNTLNFITLKILKGVKRSCLNNEKSKMKCLWWSFYLQIPGWPNDDLIIIKLNIFTVIKDLLIWLIVNPLMGSWRSYLCSLGLQVQILSVWRLIKEGGSDRTRHTVQEKSAFSFFSVSLVSSVHTFSSFPSSLSYALAALITTASSLLT